MPKKAFKHLYIHIPFCSDICTFCNLYAVKEHNQQEQQRYIDILLKRISEKQKELQEIDTVFIGGGTPLSLNIELIKYFYHKLSLILPVHIKEFTVECNPKNTTKDKLLILKKYRVNRLSFGGQSHIKKLQKIIGRRNTSSSLKNIISQAKEIGFLNINVDLIYGIQGQSIRAWEFDLTQTLELDIQHLSTYALSVNNTLAKKRIDTDDNHASDLFLFSDEITQKYHFKRYEVSNFCKNTFNCKHNLGIWQGETYLGLGASACSFDGQQRWQEISDWKQWMNRKNIKSVDYVSPRTRSSEILYTGLRTTQGWHLKHLRAILPTPEILVELKDTLDYYIKNKFLIKKNNILSPTKKGLLFADTIAEELLLLD